MVKLSKSDGQTNIEKYRVTVYRIRKEHNIISEYDKNSL